MRSFSLNNISRVISRNRYGTIQAPAAPVWVSQSAPAGTQGVAYSYTFVATGPTITYTVASGSLPGGLSLNSATGVLSGTPNTAGTSTFTIAASNSGGSVNSIGQSVTIGAASATITPVIAASVASGGSMNMPASVHMNGMSSTTTNSDANNVSYAGIFRQLRYDWDFGDTGSGNWRTNSRSKNTASGPYAHHVYETTGSKTVTLVVTLGNPWQSSSASSTMDYTVGTLVTNGGNTYLCTSAHTPGSFSTDLGAGKWTLVSTGLNQAQTTYSFTITDITAANTICVNGTGTNDLLGPTGCTYVAGMPNAATITGKKLLLRAGADRGNLPTLTGTQSCIIGKYGSGTNPVIGTYCLMQHNGTGYVAISDVTVNGSGNGTVDFTGVFNFNCANLLLLRGKGNTSQTDSTCVVGTTSGSEDWASFHHIALVDCDLGATNNTLTQYAVFGTCRFLAVQGCVTYNAGNHDFRFPGVHSFVISHNTLPGLLAGSGVDVLKLHSMGVNIYPAGSSGTWATDQGVVSWNTIGDAACPSQWYYSPCPENSTAQEGVQNVICEYNTFISGPNAVAHIANGGKNLISRYNNCSNGNLLVGTGHVPATGFNGPYFNG